MRGEYLGLVGRALGLGLDHAVGDRLARLSGGSRRRRTPCTPRRPPAPVSIGRMPEVAAAGSGAPSITTAWPLPDSPTKLTPSTHLIVSSCPELQIECRRTRVSADFVDATLAFCDDATRGNAAVRQICLHGAAAICEIITVCGLAVLLLRHRRRIPPFSSYGGILRRGPQDRAFFWALRVVAPIAVPGANLAVRLTARGMSPTSSNLPRC